MLGRTSACGTIQRRLSPSCGASFAGSALGVAFRRHVPIDRYIVHYLATASKLVVQVDGGIHAVWRARDARRDCTLQLLGYRVLRIDAELVRRNTAEAVALIVAELRSAP
jgi:very-short-patch-repair endonuclease